MIGTTTNDNNQGTFQFCEMTLHNSYIADGSAADTNMLNYFRNKWKTLGVTLSTTTSTQQGELSAGAALSAVSIANDGTLFIAPKNNLNCFRWNSGVNPQFVNTFSQLKVPTAAQAWGQGAPQCFDLAVAPSNSNIVYAVVSSLGSTTVWKSANSGTSWTDTGHVVPFAAAPGAGPCVAIDPSDPTKVLIGCSNGHIHQSTDSGVNWTDRTITGGGSSYPCIVFESTTSIYVGWLAGATNVLHSSDSGANFSSPASSGPTTVRGLTVSSDGVVYACSNAGTTTNAWKLASATWSNFTSGAMTATAETWIFPAADPNNLGYVAFISTSGKLQYSLNYGVAFPNTALLLPSTTFSGSLDVAWLVNPFVGTAGNVRPPNFGCNNSYAANRIVFDPHTSGRLWLTCETGLFYLAPAEYDAGQSLDTRTILASGNAINFTLTTSDFTVHPDVPILVASTSSPTNFMTCTGLAFNTGTKLLTLITTGFGGSGSFSDWTITQPTIDWQQQNKNQQGLQVNDLCRVPVQSNLMNNMLFVCQTKSGATPNAQRVGPTFMVGGPTSDDGLCCDYAKNSTLFQFMVTTAALWKSIDFGADGFCASDGTTNIGAVPGIDSKPMMAVVNDTTLCVLSGTGKKFTSSAITNSTPTWADCTGLPVGSASNGRSHVVVNDGVTATTLYAMIPSNGVYKSTNSGAAWTQATASSASLPASYATGSQLCSVPGQTGHLWFAGGNSGALPLARSTDGGVTWSALSNTTEAWQVSVGATKSGASYPTIFITGKIQGDSDPGIFRSTDTGTTWTRVCRAPGGNLDYPNKIFADLDNYGTFFVTMGSTGYCFGELDYA
jgi:hypothetical protein